jgi:hypothetical protein
MIYLLTAIVLSPGGSTHLHTNNTENNTNNNWATQIINNVEECGSCHVFASSTLAFALQLSEKHGKTSVRVRKNLSQVNKNLSQCKKNLSHCTKNLSQCTIIQQPLRNLNMGWFLTMFYECTLCWVEKNKQQTRRELKWEELLSNFHV